MLKKKYFELNASLIFHAATSIFLFVSALPLWSFLDGSTHLYMRVCPSVGRSIRPSVTRYFQLLEMGNFLNENIGADQL